MKKPTRLEEKLLNVRSVKELLLLLKPLKENIGELGEATERLLKSVSSTRKRGVIRQISISANEIELGNIKQTRSSPKTPSVRSVLDAYVSPDMSDLVQDNDSLRELTTSIRELDVAEQVLMSNSLSSLPGQDSALKSIRKLRSDAQKVLDNHLKAMSTIAQKNTPQQHKAVIKATLDFITSQLDDTSYSNIVKRTFIYNPKRSADTLHYQTYLLIEDFVNSEGDTYDRYAIVITGVLDLDTGTLVHHATSIKDHSTPGSFEIGPEVETFAKLKRRITTLFNLDSFMVRGLRKAIPHTADILLKNTDLPESSKYIVERSIGKKKIKAIRVKNSEIYVQLKGSLTDLQEQEAVASIMASLRKIFAKEIGGSRNSIVRRKQRGKVSGATWYSFVISPTKSNGRELTAAKLNQIADVLGLTKEQIAGFKQQVLN